MDRRLVATGLLLFLTSKIYSAQNLSQVSQYGITWTFDRSYECGQFVNGDWWVVGPVIITNISPDSLGGRNGWEVNPNDTRYQGFDSRFDSYDGTRVPALPYTAQPNSSIVKSISVTGICNTPNAQSCLQTAAVLTVLGGVPPNDGTTSFRPPYFGTDKSLTDVASLHPELLPTLAPVANTPPLADIENWYARVQLDHKTGATGRQMHPVQNMPDYYADICQNSNEAALRLMLSDSPAAKRNALIRYVQYGIDLYEMYDKGHASWTEHGLGRKLTMAFAAVVLDNAAMKTAIQTAGMNRFEEDYAISDNGRGQIIWGETDTYNQYWRTLMDDSGGRFAKDPHRYIDGGPRPGGTYQFCCFDMPVKGAVLPLVLMPSLATVWNNTQTLAYIDRIVTLGGWAQPDACAPMIGVCGPGSSNPGQRCTSAQENDTANMGFSPFCGGPCIYGTPANNTHYGVDFGPVPGNQAQCIQDTDSSDGIGRFPLLQGASRDVGYYDSGFVRSMWTAYRGLTVPNRAPIVSAGQDRTLDLPQTSLSLGGSVTDDGLPNPPARTTAQWSQVNGPAPVVFSNAQLATTNATFSHPGTYVLRLTGNDSALSASDDVQIAVISDSGAGGQNSVVTETKLVPCSNPKDRREPSRIPICFDLKEPGNVTLTLYSRHGSKIRELKKGYQGAGKNEIFWNLNDDSGNAVASGTYIINFESSGVNQTSKVVVVR